MNTENPAEKHEKQSVDDAALTIHATMNDSGYTSEEKVQILNSVRSLVRGDIDDEIKSLEKLRTAF